LENVIRDAVTYTEHAKLKPSFAMSTLIRFHLPLVFSRFHTAFKDMPLGACHGRMPQPVLTCASVVVQLVTSVDGELNGGI
jgi:hypothetical protein